MDKGDRRETIRGIEGRERRVSAAQVIPGYREEGIERGMWSGRVMMEMRVFRHVEDGSRV